MRNLDNLGFNLCLSYVACSNSSAKLLLMKPKVINKAFSAKATQFRTPRVTYNSLVYCISSSCQLVHTMTPSIIKYHRIQLVLNLVSGVFFHRESFLMKASDPRPKLIVPSAHAIPSPNPFMLNGA